MSRESAVQFLRKLGKDLKLMDEVKAVDKNGLLNVAKIRGYDCTLDELRTVAAEITQKAADGSETLSEEELEMVTGGVNPRRAGVRSMAIRNLPNISST